MAKNIPPPPLSARKEGWRFGAQLGWWLGWGSFLHFRTSHRGPPSGLTAQHHAPQAPRTMGKSEGLKPFLIFVFKEFQVGGGPWSLLYCPSMQALRTFTPGQGCLSNLSVPAAISPGSPHSTLFFKAQPQAGLLGPHCSSRHPKQSDNCPPPPTPPQGRLTQFPPPAMPFPTSPHPSGPKNRGSSSEIHP